LAAEELARDWRSWLDEIGTLARTALALPARLDQFLSDAQRGDLTMQTTLAADTARALRRIERSVARLTWVVVALGLLTTGIAVRSSVEPDWPSAGLFVLAGLSLVWAATRR